MGLWKTSWMVLQCWLFLGLCLRVVHCDTSQVSVKFWKTPRAFSNLNSAEFAFQVFVGDNCSPCASCLTNCTLDHRTPSRCDTRKVSFVGLKDGNHTFEVCSNRGRRIGCARYNWTVDTIPPTAYITAATSFTNTINVSVNISFSEPCSGGGGFGCSSTNSCNVSTCSL
ncbi:hypothetical protein NMG60_11019316 [Bertholletia excelsa]